MGYKDSETLIKSAVAAQCMQVSSNQADSTMTCLSKINNEGCCGFAESMRAATRN